MSHFQQTKITNLVDKVEKWNPVRDAPGDLLDYIDISAIDRDSKTISEITCVVGREAPSRARQLVKTGDVLVSTVRPNLNAVAQVSHELDGATASTGYCVLRSKNSSLDSRYLFHWVRTPAFVDNMMLLATGASYPAVSDKIVRASKIPLPPLPEQQRIAAILDKADALRAKRRAALAKLDTLLQATFLDTFGDPVTNPMGWEVRPLIAIVDEQRPITYGILMPGPNLVDGIPYVRVVDMAGGNVLTRQLRRTSPKISEQYKRSKLIPDDLLLSIRGHVGRLALVPTEIEGGNITQDTARLATNDLCNVHYVMSVLASIQMQRFMQRFVKGVAVKGINLGDVKKLPIIIPPIEMQDEFAVITLRFHMLKKSHKSHLHELDNIFHALQQRAFKGEL